MVINGEKGERERRGERERERERASCVCVCVCVCVNAWRKKKCFEYEESKCYKLHVYICVSPPLYQ